jgi:hypothetical protein
MTTLSPSSRASRPPRSLRRRGQTMILGAVAMLVLALIVFITFNVTVAVQQKIKLQNYADAKAFSMAVAEARTLNYLAYTNRAIASAYVGMANVHAYMSEAAVMADMKAGGMAIMVAIAGQEKAQCLCCWGGPCCFQHCLHAAEAWINVAGLTIDWISGKMGGKVRQLDGPARSTLNALNTHITTLNGAQTVAKTSIPALLLSGTMGELKRQNMQKADTVTSDDTMVAALNLQQWQRVFYSNQQIKQRIMAETVNATRSDFAWSRSGVTTPALFPPNWVADNMKASLWMGPKGTWLMAQIPTTTFMAGGRSGFTDSGFSGFGSFKQDIGRSTRGQRLSSFDWGTISGQWRHGFSTFTLPTGAPFFTAGMETGNNGNSHSVGWLGDIFNNPHNGANHNMNMDMSRFSEFNIGTSYPFNQPSVYAAATTDTRVNEYGKRGPWEVNKSQSGTITVSGVGNTDGRLVIANNNPTKAFSKAMVYYHRIGDWSDYPNLFNPYWRAKLEPLSQTEVFSALAIFDSNAAQVAGGAGFVNSSAVNVK